MVRLDNGKRRKKDDGLSLIEQRESTLLTVWPVEDLYSTPLKLSDEYLSDNCETNDKQNLYREKFIIYMYCYERLLACLLLFFSTVNND